MTNATTLLDRTFKKGMKRDDIRELNWIFNYSKKAPNERLDFAIRQAYLAGRISGLKAGRRVKK